MESSSSSPATRRNRDGAPSAAEPFVSAVLLHAHFREENAELAGVGPAVVARPVNRRRRKSNHIGVRNLWEVDIQCKRSWRDSHPRRTSVRPAENLMTDRMQTCKDRRDGRLGP